MVKLGPENSHPDEPHFAEGRAEAVQQELVRVWPAARAAPEGAVQAQGLVCQESQTVHESQLYNKPDAYYSFARHARAQVPLCRLRILPSGKSLQKLQACKSCKPAGAMLNTNASHVSVYFNDRHTARPSKAKAAAGRTDALLCDLVAGGRRLPRRDEALKCPHLF